MIGHEYLKPRCRRPSIYPIKIFTGLQINLLIHLLNFVIWSQNLRYQYDLCILLYSYTDHRFWKVVDIHIKDSLTVMGPLTTWGKAGQYQFVSGEITFGIDRIINPIWAICDLHLAPVNKQGLIEAKTNFIVLQAVEKVKEWYDLNRSKQS